MPSAAMNPNMRTPMLSIGTFVEAVGDLNARARNEALANPRNHPRFTNGNSGRAIWDENAVAEQTARETARNTDANRARTFVGRFVAVLFLEAVLGMACNTTKSNIAVPLIMMSRKARI